MPLLKRPWPPVSSNRGVRLACLIAASWGAAVSDATAQSAKPRSEVIDVMNSTKLKKFSFTIDKTTPVANQEKWTITFDLLERDDKTKPFPAPADATIHVKIDVSPENVPKIAATALADDFTVKQTQYVLTVVAAAAKKFKAGDLTQDEFNAIVEATMAAR